MFDWSGRRPPKIPDGMIILESAPIGDDRAPTWTSEIESKTQRFGREFVVPAMYETSPGQCLGVLVAKAVYQTPLRTYEARATLIKRTNDEFRTTIVVTAPPVPEWESGDDEWNACNLKYIESLTEDQAKAMIPMLRRYCEQSHEQERAEKASWEEKISAPVTSIEKSIALLSARTDRALLDKAEKAKGHISMAAVHDEYGRLVWQKIRAEEGTKAQQEGRRAKVSGEFSPWEIIPGEYDELTRAYYFANLGRPGARMTVELRCRLDTKQRTIRPFVYLIFQPYLLGGTQAVPVFIAPPAN